MLPTVAISVIVSEDAFARERYSGDSPVSTRAAVSNDCLNPILDSNTIDNAVGVGNCGGTVSQQDESGQASAPITSQTANPAIELQRSTTTTPPPGLGASMTCEECFDILSATQETAIETMLWATFNTQQRGSAGSDIVELIGDIHVCEKNSSRHTPLFGRVSWLILKERSRIMGS